VVQGLQPPTNGRSAPSTFTDETLGSGRAGYLRPGSLSGEGPQRNSSPRGPRTRRLLVCLAWVLPSLTPSSCASLLARLLSAVNPVFLLDFIEGFLLSLWLATVATGIQGGRTLLDDLQAFRASSCNAGHHRIHDNGSRVLHLVRHASCRSFECLAAFREAPKPQHQFLFQSVSIGLANLFGHDAYISLLPLASKASRGWVRPVRAERIFLLKDRANLFAPFTPAHCDASCVAYLRSD
jgi:hypothetical protein